MLTLAELLQYWQQKSRSFTCTGLGTRDDVATL
jgi:hypothetical protein